MPEKNYILFKKDGNEVNCTNCNFPLFWDVKEEMSICFRCGRTTKTFKISPYPEEGKVEKVNTIRGEKISIKRFENLYRFINNNIVKYLDLDYKTEIPIHYNNKCFGLEGYCEFGIDCHYLPSLSLHHRLLNYSNQIFKKNFEKIDFNIIFRTDYESMLKKIVSQIGGLDLLCRNHHILFHNKRYSFSPIFYFLKNVDVNEINQRPAEIIKKSNNLSLEYYKMFIEPKINFERSKKWHDNKINRSLLKDVKKKYIFEFLWGKNYHCPICRIANIDNHLNVFVAHHTNLNLFEEKKIIKTNFKVEYMRRTIAWLIEQFIVQECILICSNCHQMIHITYYRDILNNIFKTKEDIEFIKNFYKKLDEIIIVYRNKILELKKLLNNELIITDPLGEIFSKFEILERNLVCIYYISEGFSNGSKNLFTSKELGSTLGKASDYFRTSGRSSGKREELLKAQYITLFNYTSQNVPLFQITDKGIEKAKKIINIKLKKYFNE